MTNTPPVPNEQARAYLAAQPPKRPFWERGVAELRREYRDEAVAAAGDPEPLASVDEVIVAGVPARLYRPSASDNDVLVWLHGGAWMVGDLDSYDAVVRAIANRASCAVLSVDYRLAPENPYPAAIEDAWTATQWAAEHYSRVAVGGDSAGGNLAAAVALRARDGGVAVALQLLIYPVLDYRPDSPSYEAYRERYEYFAGIEQFGAHSQEGIRHIWRIYAPEPARRAEPDASPLQAASLRGVAPALIITAEHDILRQEGEAYARRLDAAGVPVDLINYEGQVHNFYLHLATMDDARHAVDRTAHALRSALVRETRAHLGATSALQLVDSNVQTSAMSVPSPRAFTDISPHDGPGSRGHR